MSNEDLASQLMGGLRSLFGKEPAAAPRPEPKPQNAYGSYAPRANQLPARAIPGGPTVKKLNPSSTAPLKQAAGTRNLPSPEEKSEESRRRMAVIVTYLKSPEKLGELQDSRFLYKVITDERAYIQEVLGEWQQQLRDFTGGWAGDPEDPRFVAARDDMALQIESLTKKQAQMFMLLKKLTGVRGKTGGTGFLALKPRDEEGK